MLTYLGGIGCETHLCSSSVSSIGLACGDHKFVGVDGQTTEKDDLTHYFQECCGFLAHHLMSPVCPK